MSSQGPPYVHTDMAAKLTAGVHYRHPSMWMSGNFTLSPHTPPRRAALCMPGFSSHGYGGDLGSNIHNLLPFGPGIDTASIPSAGPEQDSMVGDGSEEGRSVLLWCKDNNHTSLHNIVYSL